MKGLIGKGLPALALALVCLGSGCTNLFNLVDPCYPERYWDSSRGLVNEAFAPQVNNGHVLDQTIWNDCFEPGTDRLNVMGLQRLSYLARRRPQPDPVVFLQTAQDLPFDQMVPQQLAILRQELDGKRRYAVEQFLMAQTSGRVGNFQVVVHDPGDTGLPGIPANLAVQQMYQSSRGSLSAGGVVGSAMSGSGGSSGGSTGGAGSR